MVVLGASLLLVAGCYGIGDLTLKDAAPDEGYPDGENAAPAGPNVTAYTGVASGMGAFRTESVRGWLVIGGEAASEKIQTESHQLHVGISAALNRRNIGDKK